MRIVLDGAVIEGEEKRDTPFSYVGYDRRISYPSQEIDVYKLYIGQDGAKNIRAVGKKIEIDLPDKDVYIPDDLEHFDIDSYGIQQIDKFLSYSEKKKQYIYKDRGVVLYRKAGMKVNLIKDAIRRLSGSNLINRDDIGWKDFGGIKQVYVKQDDLPYYLKLADGSNLFFYEKKNAIIEKASDIEKELRNIILSQLPLGEIQREIRERLEADEELKQAIQRTLETGKRDERIDRKVDYHTSRLLDEKGYYGFEDSYIVRDITRNQALAIDINIDINGADARVCLSRNSLPVAFDSLAIQTEPEMIKAKGMQDIKANDKPTIFDLSDANIYVVVDEEKRKSKLKI